MTITDVYAGATASQKEKLRNTLINKGVSYTTVYFWYTGQRKPARYTMPMVVEAVNDTLGTNHTAEELWPEEA